MELARADPLAKQMFTKVFYKNANVYKKYKCLQMGFTKITWIWVKARLQYVQISWEGIAVTAQNMLQKENKACKITGEAGNKSFKAVFVYVFTGKHKPMHQIQTALFSVGIGSINEYTVAQLQLLCSKRNDRSRGGQ